jgi:hypothetical protein
MSLHREGSLRITLDACSEDERGMNVGVAYFVMKRLCGAGVALRKVAQLGK